MARDKGVKVRRHAAHVLQLLRRHRRTDCPKTSTHVQLGRRTRTQGDGGGSSGARVCAQKYWRFCADKQETLISVRGWQAWGLMQGLAWRLSHLEHILLRGSESARLGVRFELITHADAGKTLRKEERGAMQELAERPNPPTLTLATQKSVIISRHACPQSLGGG